MRNFAAGWTLLIALGALAIGIGCMRPNTQVDLSTMPTQPAAPVLAQAQTRVIPLALEKVFPRALDALLDMGFLVRSANQESGLVNVYKTWRDPSRSQLSLEATLMFRSEGASSTRVRMAAMGNWKFISVGGPKSADADVSGLSSIANPEEYSEFLDRLSTAISAGHK